MDKPLKLSPRLLAAASQVRPGATAADVGTDHGYLACYLALQTGCPKVYASDLNPKPLEQAVRTIAENGLEGRVLPILSDGVKELPLSEIDDVIVAGMGGDLILSILSDPRLFDPEKRLILQPMSKAEVLRRGLYRMGFELIRETAVRDGRFVYTVLAVRYTGISREVDEFFALTGLLSGKTPDERAYLSRVLEKVKKKTSGLSRAGNEVPEKLKQLVERLEEKLS